MTKPAAPPQALVESSVPLPHHQLFDGVVDDHPSRARVRSLLLAIIHDIGMTRISPVNVSASADLTQGLVMIAESHIAAHFFRRLAWVDVFSCRAFDDHAILELLRRRLGGHWHAQDLRRWHSHDLARQAGLLDTGSVHL